ncbi:MAG: DNA (cytosine-5-)-methyltransferase [Bacteroidetes bacterium]|uniref:DNA cytosine methyltransferase n=1 Tax=Flavobacterium sp. TaxID=239 RepID=UPI002FDA9B21|nr:DNA (cytosine-5-)-methyltransferase [Bacteroidota bacterium]
MNNNKFTFIDLFSGIGGFRLALNDLGGNCVGFSEINNDAIKTYCENFNETNTYNFGDIKKIKNLPHHDLMTAGVPCQSWSIAGKNLGFDDDRGQLWNDTIYLLNKAKPKAFIFENVKGLIDPRNKNSFSYIMDRIKQAGYYADYYLLNSKDFGVPQNRLRVYIIGFLEESYFLKFNIPKKINKNFCLNDILNINEHSNINTISANEIEDNHTQQKRKSTQMSLSQNKGLNDYFLFNDLRNGHTTIHSWDIIPTTEKQKKICYLLLQNRRKSTYGILDGNPLSLNHFINLDSTITLKDLLELESLGILKSYEYKFKINDFKDISLDKEEFLLLNCSKNDILSLDILKSDKEIKRNKISITKNIEKLKYRNIVTCIEIRYDFKNSKISTGLNGINRIFLPKSKIYPTLVASDTNDYVSLTDVSSLNEKDFKVKFINEIYNKGLFRKITLNEACLIQGFPSEFKLPDSRARWMKLIGNSVSVPVINLLGKAIIDTGVFGNNTSQSNNLKKEINVV